MKYLNTNHYNPPNLPKNKPLWAVAYDIDNDTHPHKWAMIPTMRKLLSLLNRIARDPNFSPIPEPESTKDNVKVGRKKKTA